MAACLGRLGWTPDAFWKATPREVAAAMTGLGIGRQRGAQRLGRAELEALMRRFPDTVPRDEGAKQ